MAIYRNISLSFWTDGKVVDDFTPEDKYFYLYLITNPHTNLCGCYEISTKQMSNETGYNTDTLNKLLERFQNIHTVIEYSKETKEVLLLNWSKYNWSASPKLDKPLLKDIESIKNTRFRDFLGEIYNKRETISIPYQYGIEKSGYPMDTTVTVSVTDTVPGTDQDEQLKVPKELKTKRAGIHPMFDAFWQAYPKKVGKADALKAFTKLKPDSELMQTILAAIAQWSKTDQWSKDNRQYVPMPATYIRGRRWEDELPQSVQKLNAHGLPPGYSAVLSD